MMFGWLRPSAILASSTNIVTNCLERAYAEWIFLITSVLLRPCATTVRARNTSAMPPVPIFLISEYLPNCSIDRSDALDASRASNDSSLLPPERAYHNGAIDRLSNQVSVSQLLKAKYS